MTVISNLLGLPDDCLIEIRDRLGAGDQARFDSVTKKINKLTEKIMIPREYLSQINEEGSSIVESRRIVHLYESLGTTSYVEGIGRLVSVYIVSIAVFTFLSSYVLGLSKLEELVGNLSLVVISTCGIKYLNYQKKREVVDNKGELLDSYQILENYEKKNEKTKEIFREYAFSKLTVDLYDKIFEERESFNTKVSFDFYDKVFVRRKIPLMKLSLKEFRQKSYACEVLMDYWERSRELSSVNSIGHLRKKVTFNTNKSKEESIPCTII